MNKKKLKSSTGLRETRGLVIIHNLKQRSTHRHVIIDWYIKVFSVMSASKQTGAEIIIISVEISSGRHFSCFLQRTLEDPLWNKVLVLSGETEQQEALSSRELLVDRSRLKGYFALMRRALKLEINIQLPSPWRRVKMCSPNTRSTQGVTRN